MAIALEGLTILDVTQGVAGPYCTRMLAQMGAKVIKIERPGMGDVLRYWNEHVNGVSSGHAWVNFNKESLTLNLKDPKGQKVFLELVAKADIVIENFAPGTMESFGITYDKLKEKKEDIIYCRISGFGQDGPYRDRTALDMIIQGESGLLMTNGHEDAPAKVSISICDIAGAMFATVGILEALYYREKYHIGQVIDVSLLDGIVNWLGYFPYMWWYRQEEPERVGVNHHTIVPCGAYKARDGRYVVVSGGASDDQFKKFCQCIGEENLLNDPRYKTSELRLINRKGLEELVSRAIAKNDRDYWVEVFVKQGLPAGVMRSISEAMEHPSLLSRKMIQEVDSIWGKIKVFDHPVKMSECENVLRSGPPGLGQHTDSILKEFGFGENEIRELKETGVV